MTDPRGPYPQACPADCCCEHWRTIGSGPMPDGRLGWERFCNLHGVGFWLAQGNKTDGCPAMAKGSEQ